MPLIGAALLLLAGALAWGALLHLLVGLQRPFDRRRLALAGICGATSGLAVSHAISYSLDDLASMAVALRVGIALIILGLVCLQGFFSTYASALSGRFQWVTLLVAVAVFVANAMSEASLQFSSIDGIRTLLLPWGERLQLPVGELNPLFPLAAGWMLTITVYGIGVFLLAWRRRRSVAMLGYAVATAIFLLAALQGILVRVGYLDPPHLGPLGLVLVAFAISAIFTMDQRRARLAAESRVRDLAYCDALTGLPNRSLLMERLRTACVAAGSGPARGTLLHLDLDHFRNINDALGHATGDQVLRAVADGLRREFGEYGLVASMGGDEFAMLLAPAHDQVEAIGLNRVSRLTRALRSFLEGEVEVQGRSFSLGASIGIAHFPDGDSSAEDVLRHAELALYRAKKRGRGQSSSYTPSLMGQAERHLEIESGLRLALKRGELSLAFQAKVNASYEVTGAEALLRWRHPELGVIAPADFIEVAEATGLIHPLGEWVLRQACTRLQVWRASGVPFHGELAVNISPWQIRHPNFVRNVEEVLRGSRCTRGEIVLEVTESALLLEPGESMSALAELRRVGARIALDDFGTGYSSLSHLRAMPLDEIKIDRAFVAELDTVGDRVPIAKIILDIGHDMGLKVTAEGVETTLQHERLRELGCASFQGYLYGRPMDEAAFVTLLAGPLHVSAALAAAAGGR